MIPAVLSAVLAAGAAVGAGLRAAEAPDEIAEVGTTESTTSAPTTEPGSRLVRLADDATAHPDADEVRRVLQNHFDAINSGDYDLWTSTVTADRVRATGRAAWRQQYRSTLDGDIRVHRLEPRPGGGLVALLSFTSVQDPADAPADMPVRCLHWRVSYPLVVERGELRLALTPPNASLRTPC